MEKTYISINLLVYLNVAINLIFYYLAKKNLIFYYDIKSFERVTKIKCRLITCKVGENIEINRISHVERLMNELRIYKYIMFGQV